MSWQPERQADWLSLVDALAIILENVRTLPAETIPLDRSLGRTLAADVQSPIEHPPWDNSAMDGYAVRAVDVAGATREQPKSLRLIEQVPS